MKQKLFYITLFFLIIVVSGVFIHFHEFKKLPASTHTWAQSDHYALALGFYNDNFDFFHPTTFALSHQFPPKNDLADPEGITSVDFPILHYVTALVMKIFHTTSPFVFRLISFIISIIALFFIFITINRIKNLWMALFVCGFIMFQPIYCFYQNSFHVSSAAYNMFLIGCGFFFQYIHENKKKQFLLCVFFLTLAALMRFTQIIFLIALFCTFTVSSIKNKKIDKRLIHIALGISIVMLYFLYNKFLTATYGSIFLNTPIIPSSFQSLAEFLESIYNTYRVYFLPINHLIVLGLFLIIFLSQKIKRIHKFSSDWLVWLLFASFGTSCFTCLMAWSMSAHDYYSLDTWLPVLTIALLYLIDKINFNFSFFKVFTPCVVIAFLIFSFFMSYNNQRTKYQNITNPELVIQDFKSSSNFLNAHTDKQTKILVICDLGWNTPMIGWNKKVYRIAWKFKEQIPKALNQNYDIIITRDAEFDNVILKNDPDFLSKVDFSQGNGKVSIWKQKK